MESRLQRFDKVSNTKKDSKSETLLVVITIYDPGGAAQKRVYECVDQQYTYGYDLAANRTSELAGTATTTSTPNNVNEITSQSGTTNRTLTYDLNGSLISAGSTRTFEWDAANRLVAINYTGTALRSEFSYDGLNRCSNIVEKNNGAVNSVRKFVWCGTDKCEFRNGSNAVQFQLYPQGQYQSGAAYFYTRDHLGSIREMTDASGTVVARYDYDPWGRSITVIGTNKPNFNFTGLYQHAKSGLDMAVYRFYDPDLGRWLSRDPTGEAAGVNLYAYVLEDPVRWVDRLGLDLRLESTYQVGGWHWRVSVDTPTGPYGQSFGMISRDLPFQGSFAANLAQPGAGRLGSGVVYPDSDPTRSIIDTFRMTPEEDAIALDMLTRELNETGPYHPLTRSCRDYSKERFDSIKQAIEQRRSMNLVNRIKEWLLSFF